MTIGKVWELEIVRIEILKILNFLVACEIVAVRILVAGDNLLIMRPLR